MYGAQKSRPRLLIGRLVDGPSDLGVSNVGIHVRLLSVRRLLPKGVLPVRLFFGPLCCTLRPCLLYTSPSPRDRQKSRMPSSA